MRTNVYLEKKMGKGVGRSKILFREMQAKQGKINY